MPFIRNSFTGFLVGVACVVVGILGVILLGSKVTLNCIRSPRATDQCEITSARLLSTQTRQIRLGEITEVTIEEYTDWLRRPGRRLSYRVVFQTRTGQVPLTEGYSSGITAKQRIADQIRAFLNSSTKPSLQITQSDSWLAFTVGGIFGAVGITLISRSIRKFDG